ncbi:MAG: triose-phosphate isomerase [Planctomycetaceae bacterium]|nr:triose-phosphate isomerase [Planctomycetaceae bacterium]
MRRKFVAGNWKMNTLGQSAAELARALAQAWPRAKPQVEVAVCPPFPYLASVGAALAGSGIELGAQNVSHEKPGALTGEIAIEMLRDLGCRWVILGHSERRRLMGETDALISKKVTAALAGGVPAILCVGETLAQREAGQTWAVLDAQMQGSLAGVEAVAMNDVVIAYEPVWAIGTGVTATTAQAQSAHAHLRRWLSIRYNPDVAGQTRILYGGSVKPDNAQSLLGQPDVDGALVGGASLKAADFLAIVRAAESIINP